MAKFKPFRGLFYKVSEILFLGVNVDQNIPKILANGVNQGLRTDPIHEAYTGRVEIPRWESTGIRVPKGSLPKETYT